MGHCLWSLDVHICSRFWKFAADGTFIFYGRIFHSSFFIVCLFSLFDWFIFFIERFVFAGIAFPSSDGVAC